MALRLGTRGSALAVAQATGVAHALEQLGEQVELIEIETSGDRRAPAGGGSGGGSPDPTDKSRFVKQIDEALLAGTIDLAVHSAKDVPGELPAGIAIVGVPPRADPRDALCLATDEIGEEAETPDAASLDELREGAVVGTASLRRRAQLQALRPDLDIRELHGNVDTRLRRLGEGELDAIVLATAGLERLGRPAEGRPVDWRTLTPAAGQGCLAIVARTGDERTRTLGERLTDSAALTALTAERVLVTELGATCNTPIGAHARIEDDELQLHAFVGAPDGANWIRDAWAGPPRHAHELGALVAERLRLAGAEELLAALEPKRGD